MAVDPNQWGKSWTHLSFWTLSFAIFAVAFTAEKHTSGITGAKPKFFFIDYKRGWLLLFARLVFRMCEANDDYLYRGKLRSGKFARVQLMHK
jgi:hypothetical protein